MSLLKKVFLTVTAIATATVIVFLYAGLYFMRATVEEAAGAQQIQLARQTMFTLDRSLYSRYQQAGLVASDSSLSAVAATPGDAKLRAVAATKLTTVVAQTSGWDLLELVTKDGAVLASSNPDRAGKMLAADAAAYRTLLDTAAGGKEAYSDALRSAETDKPTLLYAVPVRVGAVAEAPVGAILVAQTAWPSVLAILQNNVEANFELFNKQGVELGDSQEVNVSEVLSKNMANSPVVRSAIAGQEGSRRAMEVDGDREVLMSYTGEKGYKDYHGNGWVLVAQAPTATVFASINEAQRILTAVFFGIVILAIALVMVVLNHIVLRHVNVLTRLAQNIAAGDLTARAHIRTTDEFGQLGQSFNRMADKLQEFYRGLEAKVQAKTGELAEQIAQSEAARVRDEAILAGMGEGLVALNEKGEVTLVNVRASEIFGIEREKMLGQRLATLLDSLQDEHDGPIVKGYRPEERAAETKEVVSGEYTYHRYLTDGQRMMLTMNATPISSNGQFVGVVLVVRDMTKEKEVDRMKTEFISLASHQLRTPLSAIKWFGQMLVAGDAGKLTPEQQEFAQNIYDSTQRMIELVNSLLNISRLESGRIVVDPHPVNLQELVNGIVKELQPKIDAKYQHFVLSIVEGMPQINLDTRLMSEILSNLLTNAIKYTPKEGTITVLVSQTDTEIITQVTDTGLGIPMAQQKRVFEKFFRADNIVKIETDGTGLGLYMVKAIVESCGGKLWFKSEEGKGTSFWFSLPVTGMQAKAGEVVLDEA